MWCPNCQEDFEIVKGAEVQACPKCCAADRQGKRIRRLPKLNPTDSTPKIRVDPGHGRRPLEIQSEHDTASASRAWFSNRSMIHMAVFGLLVFLVGQVVLVWAFVIGHYVAWSAANLISVVGIAISIVSVSVTLRNLERRINGLAKMAGRNKTEKRSRRTSLQSTRN